MTLFWKIIVCQPGFEPGPPGRSGSSLTQKRVSQYTTDATSFEQRSSTYIHLRISQIIFFYENNIKHALQRPQSHHEQMRLRFIDLKLRHIRNISVSDFSVIHMYLIIGWTVKVEFTYLNMKKYVIFMRSKLPMKATKKIIIVKLNLYPVILQTLREWF